MAKKLQPSENFSPVFNRLILLCENKNITVSNLLDEFTTSRSSMTAWKNGIIHTSIIPQIATRLDVSIEYLLTGIEAKTQPNDFANANEKTMMLLFRQLSEKEQDRIIGRIENIIETSEENKNKDAI